MPPKLGELLVANGLLTPAQVQQALEAQKLYGGRIGTNLVELKLISDDELARFLARQFRMPAAEAKDFEGIPPALISLLDAATAERHHVIPIRLDKRLVVALSDPTDIAFVDSLTFKAGKPVSVFIAPEIWIVAALERYYGVARPVRYVSVEDEEISFRPEVAYDISTPVVSEFHPKKPAPKKSLSFGEFVERVAKAVTKEDVFAGLLDLLAAVYPRTAVFVARQGTIGGWLLRGFPVREKDFVSLLLPDDEPTVLRGVMENHDTFSGALPTDTRDARVADLLGIPSDAVVDVYPVLFRGRGIAAVLGLREASWGDRERTTVDTVESACGRAGLGLEMIALKREILKIPAR